MDDELTSSAKIILNREDFCCTLFDILKTKLCKTYISLSSRSIISQYGELLSLSVCIMWWFAFWFIIPLVLLLPR